MIISKNISITRIISGTWKHFVFNIVTCVLSYYLVRITHPDFEIPVLIPSVLGTALAFFIGFNNNQAYDRWWEARKVWGALVNDSRTWTRAMLHFPNTDTIDRDGKVKTAIYRHISFLYALKQNLRKSDENEFEKYISSEDIHYVNQHANKANALLNLQTRDLNHLYELKELDGFKFQALNSIQVSFCNEMGKAERISNTVFPTTYNYYTRFFIWFFVVFVTIVTAKSIGIWSIAAGTLLGYVFLTTHKIGESLLNPFEDIASGVPLNSITRTIEINMLQTLGESNLPEPIQSIDGEYIM